MALNLSSSLKGLSLSQAFPSPVEWTQPGSQDKENLSPILRLSQKRSVAVPRRMGPKRLKQLETSLDFPRIDPATPVPPKTGESPAKVPIGGGAMPKIRTRSSTRDVSLTQDSIHWSDYETAFPYIVPAVREPSPEPRRALEVYERFEFDKL